MEADGVKRCREHCYDEFRNPLFENSRGSLSFNADCSVLDEIATVVAATAGAYFLIIICCYGCLPIALATPIVIGLICICKTFNDRSPIDKKINEAEKQAKQKLE